MKISNVDSLVTALNELFEMVDDKAKEKANAKIGEKKLTDVEAPAETNTKPKVDYDKLQKDENRKTMENLVGMFDNVKKPETKPQEKPEGKNVTKPERKFDPNEKLITIKYDITDLDSLEIIGLDRMSDIELAVGNVALIRAVAKMTEHFTGMKWRKVADALDDALTDLAVSEIVDKIFGTD